jgi:hypothetical protein
VVNAERLRLDEAYSGGVPWSRWGPYLSERQWGTVREDYGSGDNTWSYFTNAEGNHGEDVKECYFYLDATPTSSYLKMLYKYPQAEFPYAELIAVNAARGKPDPEYELLDTGIFDNNRYFDVVIEYAKATPEDLLMQVTAHNRGPENAELHVLPTLWCDLMLFYEYFHGDNGAGIGASHQTGWTGTAGLLPLLFRGVSAEGQRTGGRGAIKRAASGRRMEAAR